jgi:glycerate kinase
MSDGGDGFGAIVSRLLAAREQSVATVDAAHRRITSRWWWVPRTKTAVIESATVIGLAMLPPGKYHPFELDTFGLGKVLQTAGKRGCRRCLVGIGGSATNDGGFGLARALGWNFLDPDDRPIDRWTELHRLRRIIRPTPPPFARMKVTVAVDVQNRLLGTRGASRVYGPQKGLRPQDFPEAERSLRRLAVVARRQFQQDYAGRAGAGAAGGLGFGLFAFLNARAEAGVALFARHAHLNRRLRAADLVITGEGAIDKSTLMGKGVGEVARRCGKFGVPCIGLGGVLNDEALLKRRFKQVHCLTPELTNPAEARAEAAVWLARLAARVARDWDLR